jgi:hypothetical protein
MIFQGMPMSEFQANSAMVENIFVGSENGVREPVVALKKSVTRARPGKGRPPAKASLRLRLPASRRTWRTGSTARTWSTPGRAAPSDDPRKDRALASNAQQPYSARKLYLPGDLEAQIEAFITDYKHLRYHKSIGNPTPADVCLGRGQTILIERKRIKRAAAFPNNSDDGHYTLLSSRL